MLLEELFESRFLTKLREDFFGENKRLYSSITLDEVPEKYKNLKLLGRGTTSLVFNYDNNNVLILTKDKLKYEWAKEIFGNKARYIESLNPKIHKKFGKIIGDRIDVFIIPKLLPLNQQEKNKVKKFLKIFYDEYFKKLNAYYIKHGLFKSMGEREQSEIALEVLKDLLDREDLVDLKSQIEKLVNFIINYNPESYITDFQLKNFMKTPEGEILFLDPIADKEIVDFYFQLKSN